MGKTPDQYLEFVRRKKGGANTGIQTKNPREGSFRCPPLAEFGADAARSFADQTTGVGSTGVRSRRARWRSGVGKMHLDIITTVLYYTIRIRTACCTLYSCALSDCF